MREATSRYPSVLTRQRRMPHPEGHLPHGRKFGAPGRVCISSICMAGEELHQVGAAGVRRAKRWLEATTRVETCWTNEDQAVVARLTYDWPHGGQSASFDLGGILSGGDLHQQAFMAEVKKYADAGNQGEHYDRYLAGCYVNLQQKSALADHFMWITWAPFRRGTWADHCKPAAVEKALLVPKNAERVFGTDKPEEAQPLIDGAIVDAVAARLWLIVLSDKQETLVISAEDRALVMRERSLKEYG